ncbi:uncharacterized protein MONOS_6840 [Monocercomonoides exilis]|uniref:uncharacterized protein n=1 Tax=Monocercomonoides exilis TaxID=2049356 RepID=UPI00355A1CAC|nr:hypothetical protein MONOS_6840 [Monocercomonoides exilis]|eukprot:MONOS_6840.1-p1 / transcript=MONOS_6840.1 / gene=MONOS_6840 / organism=Monocercomonoides_exilis_PA203 / gene_product=unspecified product / transcript_product=unspecified product / location=Mono_scaffold00223:55738-57072(-) / protein_length=390 / sequence_SO=supercontig / SO=protein_coding / is_pseudo=false
MDSSNSTPQYSSRSGTPVHRSRSHASSSPPKVKTWEWWYYSKDRIDRLPASRRALVVRPEIEQRHKQLEQERDAIEKAVTGYFRSKQKAHRESQRYRFLTQYIEHQQEEKEIGTMHKLKKSRSGTATPLDSLEESIIEQGYIPQTLSRRQSRSTLGDIGISSTIQSTSSSQSPTPILSTTSSLASFADQSPPIQTRGFSSITQQDFIDSTITSTQQLNAANLASSSTAPFSPPHITSIAASAQIVFAPTPPKRSHTSLGFSNSRALYPSPYMAQSRPGSPSNSGSPLSPPLNFSGRRQSPQNMSRLRSFSPSYSSSSSSSSPTCTSPSLSKERGRSPKSGCCVKNRSLSATRGELCSAEMSMMELDNFASQLKRAEKQRKRILKKMEEP